MNRQPATEFDKKIEMVTSEYGYMRELLGVLACNARAAELDAELDPINAVYPICETDQKILEELKILKSTLQNNAVGDADIVRKLTPHAAKYLKTVTPIELDDTKRF